MRLQIKSVITSHNIFLSEIQTPQIGNQCLQSSWTLPPLKIPKWPHTHPEQIHFYWRLLFAAPHCARIADCMCSPCPDQCVPMCSVVWRKKNKTKQGYSTKCSKVLVCHKQDHFSCQNKNNHRHCTKGKMEKKAISLVVFFFSTQEKCLSSKITFSVTGECYRLQARQTKTFVVYLYLLELQQGGYIPAYSYFSFPIGNSLHLLPLFSSCIPIHCQTCLWLLCSFFFYKNIQMKTK